jgi:DNA-binding MarR family transcriptional regulator
MSRRLRRPTRTPLIALVHRANRVMQADMVRQAQERGWEDAKPAHNSVFGTLGYEGARPAELAARAGITRQSMGEVIRDLVDLGIVEMTPDPTDKRAKVVRYTELGRRETEQGGDHIVEVEEQLIAEIGVEAYENLRAGLEKVVALLESDED